MILQILGMFLNGFKSSGDMIPDDIKPESSASCNESLKTLEDWIEETNNIYRDKDLINALHREIVALEDKAKLLDKKANEIVPIVDASGDDLITSNYKYSEDKRINWNLQQTKIYTQIERKRQQINKLQRKLYRDQS